MLMIQLEEKRVLLLSHYWWLGHLVLLFFLQGHLDRPLSLRDLASGSNDVLNKNNIQQLVDLHGVGEHYMGSSN